MRSTTLALTDASRPTVSRGRTISSSRALTTRVWYPAGPSTRAWPLVVFAHGYAVGPEPYIAMCQAWAAAGYIVAEPEFPLTDGAVAGPNLDENDLINQPEDVRFVIRSLLVPGRLPATRADPEHLAVAGHSDGGVTALAVASEPLAGLRAVVAFSASAVPHPDRANPPLLVAQGDADTVNPFEMAAAVYAEAAPPRFFLTLVGGGHLAPFADGSPYLASVNQVTISFFDRYVAGGDAGGVAGPLGGARPGLTSLRADP